MKQRPQARIKHGAGVDITWLPTLAELVRLYEMPRGPGRFEAYLAWMQGGTHDVVLPVGHVNPMAGEGVLAAAQAWHTLGADEAAPTTAQAAAGALSGGSWRLGFCLCDESGGWTDRAATDAAVRFEDKGGLRRRLAAVPLWVREKPSLELAAFRVRGAMYRVAHQEAYGLPTTLRNMLLQEARAAAFSGAPERGQEADAQVARRHLDADDAATTRAVLYGDGAARRLGHAPLGVSPFGGMLAARLVYPHTTEQAIAALGRAGAA